MLYLILAPDRPGTGQLRIKERQKHLDYWQSMGERLKLAGPWLADDREDGTPLGSMLIVEANSLQEAKNLAGNDPFVDVGVFAANIEVRPVRFSLGTWKG